MNDQVTLCSTVAQLRGQMVTSSGALEPPKVLVLDQAHVGLAVLNDLKEEMIQLTVGQLLVQEQVAVGSAAARREVAEVASIEPS